MLETQKAFATLLKIIEVLGIWQRRSTKWSYRIYGFILHFIFTFLFTLFLFLYIFNFEDLLALSDCLSILFTMLGKIFKIINFIYNLENILALIQNLDELIKLSEWNGNKGREKIHKYLVKGNRLFKIFVVTGVSTCSFANLVPIFHSKERILQYRMYYPGLDYKNNLWVFILLAIFEATPVVFCLVSIALDMLPVFFMCFAIGLMEELSTRLKEIGRNEETLKTKKADLAELVKCIEIHQGVKFIVSNTQQSFATVTIVHGLMSSVILCTTAFMLTQASINYIQELYAYYF